MITRSAQGLQSKGVGRGSEGPIAEPGGGRKKTDRHVRNRATGPCRLPLGSIDRDRAVMAYSRAAKNRQKDANPAISVSRTRMGLRACTSLCLPALCFEI